MNPTSNPLPNTVSLQPETRAALEKLRDTAGGTVAFQSMKTGLIDREPLLIGLDGMIRYAKAYKTRFEQPLADDYVLGPEFGKVISGLRALLNGDGAVAMERGISTDSKDNGTLESLYWSACEAAGMDGNDL